MWHGRDVLSVADLLMVCLVMTSLSDDVVNQGQKS